MPQTQRSLNLADFSEHSFPPVLRVDSEVVLSEEAMSQVVSFVQCVFNGGEEACIKLTEFLDLPKHLAKGAFVYDLNNRLERTRAARL